MKSLFQDMDQMSKRILVIALSVSAVLLSGSVLLITASRSFAQEKTKQSALPMIGLGCDDSNVYYFDSNYEFRRKPKSIAKYDM